MFELEPNALMCSSEIYDRATAIIMEFEELRLESYDDGGGVWTIGWGSTEGVRPGMKITRDEAVKRLSSDFLYKAVHPVARLVKVPLNENQAVALYSLVFNIGEGQFSTSSLLKLINGSAPVELVAAEFPRWKYDNGKVSNGLVRRRAIEKEIFLA